MQKEVLETLKEAQLLSELVLEKADRVFDNCRRSMESRYQFSQKRDDIWIQLMMRNLRGFLGMS